MMTNDQYRVGDTVQLPYGDERSSWYVIVTIDEAITLVRKHPPYPDDLNRIYWVMEGDDATELEDHTIMGRKFIRPSQPAGELRKVPSHVMETSDRLPWEIDSYGISLGFMRDGHSLLCESCAREAYVENWGCIEPVDVANVLKMECDESCGEWVGDLEQEDLDNEYE